MTGIFVGGSPRVTHIPREATRLLESIVAESIPVLVGDANGADKALQKFFAARRYEHVTVYCAEGACRNNLGGWPVVEVRPPNRKKDFAFFAAKDRRLAEDATSGVMLWDGGSVGTLINVKRLVVLTKAVELFVTPRHERLLVRSRDDLESVLSALPEAALDEFRKKWESEEDDLAAARKPTKLLEV